MANSQLSNPSEASEADPGSSSSAGLGGLIQSGIDWFDRELWERDPESSVFERALRSTAQLIALTVSGFQTDQLLLRASGLTYVTALSIIPMLGVVIAILGVAGVNETIVNFAIDQLTTTAPEVRATVRGYAAGLDLKSFGAVGGTIVFGTSSTGQPIRPAGCRTSIRSGQYALFGIGSAETAASGTPRERLDIAPFSRVQSARIPSRQSE